MAINPDKHKFPSADPTAVKRRRVDIQAFASGESMEVDVLGMPDDSRFYAFIEKIEIQRTIRDDPPLLNIYLDCISAAWFDAFPEDLAGMPAANTIAQVARSRMVELIVTPSKLEEISHTVDQPHFHEGWWVEINIGLEQVYGNDVQCVMYLPAEWSHDPASIGTTANATVCFVRQISRVRPPGKLIKLLRFSHHGPEEP